MIQVVRRGYPNAIYIGRPSIFGNPYILQAEVDRQHVIDQYRIYFYKRLREDIIFQRACDRLLELAQVKDIYLACYCAPLPCHGDIIKEYIEGIVDDKTRTF